LVFPYAKSGDSTYAIFGFRLWHISDFPYGIFELFKIQG